MSQDDFFYCAPCRLKVLVAPLGKVRSSSFSRTLQLLRENGTTVSLKTLDQERILRTIFKPSTFPQGQLLFDFITYWDNHYTYLEDFQQWRKLFGVIAITDEENALSEEEQETQLEALRAQYKSCLVHRILQPFNSSNSNEAVTSFLADVSARLLFAISDMAQSIQGLPTIRSPMDPSAPVAVADPEQDLKRPASVGPGSLQRTPSSSSTKLSSKRNSVTASQNASSENLVEKRGTSKGRGRVLKVMGDLCMLCGVLPTAIQYYTQSVEILRLTTDYVWHGSALEGVGMTLVLLTYLKVEFSIPSILQYVLQSHVSTLSTSQDSRPSSRGAESQPPNNDFSTDPFPTQSLLDILPETHTQILTLYQRSMAPTSAEAVPPICFSDNILRLARLLCDVYATGELDAAALKANVLGIPVERNPSAYCMYPPRGEVARWAMRAWGPHLHPETIPITLRIRILAALVHIMGTIGFRRRRAALLNQLLHLFIPQLVQARVVGASEYGLHPNAAQPLVSPDSDDDTLVDLMDSLTRVYGLDIASDDRVPYGWADLKNHILKEAISFCEALPHSAGVAHFTSLLFALTGDKIDKDEQIRLAANLPRIVGATRKRGQPVEAEYWDLFVVQNIEIIKAVESELHRSTSTTKARESGASNKGPFLYQVRSSKNMEDKKDLWMVQNEEVEVEIMLRNNFEFDLEVISFSLWTEGVATDMAPSTFILPARSMHTHGTTFTPTASGTLQIKGCTIKFSACAKRDFPFLVQRPRRDKEKWYDKHGGEIKVKRIGMGFPKPIFADPKREDVQADDEDGFWIKKTLDATVLPPQPVLVLESSSSRDSCIMLLEGETRILNLRFRNLSPSSVNHLNVTFFDSTSPVLEEALASAQLAEDEASELEYFLFERPAFKWLQSPESENLIPANGTEDMQIQVHGKRGLTRGVVNVEYASVDPDAEEVGLHHRLVECSLAVTVNASVELVTCDFVPSGSSPSNEGFYPSDHFLLVLEFRNSWINALNLTLSLTKANDAVDKISQLLQSGQTRRIVIPLPRMVLPSSSWETAIPRRSRERQFIMHSEETRDGIIAARKAWWYRQHILERITGRWSEEGPGGRSGDVEMRGIRLNERHFRVVQKEVVEAIVKVEDLKGPNENSVCRRLVVDVYNHQDSTLMCVLRLALTSSDDGAETSRSVCCEGLDQSHLVTVNAQGKVSWSTEITLLAHGSYGIGAVVEERAKPVGGTGRRWTSDVCLVEMAHSTE